MSPECPRNSDTMMSDSANNKVNGHIMSLQQLISAPLVATIDADAMSTERYMKHFMSLAFESYNPADGSTGALRLISFNFTDSDASGVAEKKVSVPLISLVTLPLLQIKQADFDFDINIIDAIASAPNEHFSLNRGEVESPGGKEKNEGLNFSGLPGSAVRERRFFLPSGEHENSCLHAAGGHAFRLVPISPAGFQAAL